MITFWLKRILKYTLLLLLIILIAIIGWVSYYYVKEIRPYKPIIENILTNADPENRHPPKNLVAMVDARFYCPHKRNILGHAGNCGATKEQLISKDLVGRSGSMRTLHRHFHEIGLSWMIYNSYSAKDRHALYAELTYTGYGKSGFNNFAKQHFGKPLSELTLEESATLVGVLKGPSYYFRQPEKLEERKSYVLKRYRTLNEN